jgi:hypothetical protein
MDNEAMNLKDVKEKMRPGDKILFTHKVLLVRADGKETLEFTIQEPADIHSDPPDEFFQVTNIYVNKLGKVIVEFETDGING